MQGKDWYFQLNDYCKTLSEHYDIELIRVAGMLSALSPNCTFAQNIKSLERFLRTKGDCKVSTFGDQKRKAFEIMTTNNISEDNIKNILGKGLKTRSFFENIYRPDSSQSVTVDLWMIRYAQENKIMPLKGTLTPKRYRDIESYIQDKAQEFNVMPHQLQAITWVNIRGKEF